MLERFRDLRDTLRELHARNVIVGDLNDGNVLVGANEVRLIDCDSMQYGAYACPVAHERYLDPRLLGVAFGNAPCFTPETDWYAFGVLAVSALLFAHPYGGTHPRVGALHLRAKERISIVSKDVTYPGAAAPLHSLSDDWLDWIARTFDKGERGEMPASLLATRFAVCKQCGLEHARRVCPECATTVVVPTTIVRGRIRVTRVLRTQGSIMGVRIEPRPSTCTWISGELVREDGHVIERNDRAPDRVVLAGPSVYVVRANRYVEYGDYGVRAEGSTDSFLGEAAFDANLEGAFAVRDNYVIEVTSGRRLGCVVDGRTWLRVGESLGFAYCQTGTLSHGFVFRTGIGGLIRVEMPQFRGKLVNLAAHFDSEHVLLSLMLDTDGARSEELVLFRSDGTCVARTRLTDSQIGSGRCIAYGAVLMATDLGLVLLRKSPLHSKHAELEVTKRFPDTAGLVPTDGELVASSKGSLYVVYDREISELALT